MAQCTNCGQFNNAEANFCRFCGTRFFTRQPAQQYDYSPPRPYSWQTDEFQTSKPEARKTQQINQVQPLRAPYPNTPNPNYQRRQQQPLAHRQPQPLAASYRCPRCTSNVLPRRERRISTAGWITFGVLFVFIFTIPFCWIGLLIQEDIHTCPACSYQAG